MAKDLIEPLHGLRGCAALLVLVGHARPRTNFPPVDAAPAIGVALFFILSGFLMGYWYLGVAPSRVSIKSYIVARFARVYPLFAAVVISTILISLVTENNSSPFALHLPDLVPHLLFYGSGSTVWTISVEFQFYAAFVGIWVLYAALNRVDVGWIFVPSVLIFIAAVWIAGHPEGRINLLRYAHLFLIGILCALAFKRHRPMIEKWSPLILPWAAVLFLSSFVAIPYFYPQGQAYADPLFVAVSTALVLSAAGSQTSLVGRLLSTRTMLVLGELSFGIYLLHRPVLWVLARVPHGTRGVVTLVLVIVLTALAAWVANRIIERPARQMLRRWGRVKPGISPQQNA
jgi:peptidoglycan/LPS O-acetylase OafA/YrhL